jgi:GxxExxY protein
MNIDKHEYEDQVIRDVIGCTMEVSNTLGAGFLEKVYERALVRELRIRELPVKAQLRFSVMYKGYSVGEYCADLMVANTLIVELKCVDCLANEHLAQCINYLKISGKRVGLLLNFQHPKLEWKRVVFGF